MEPLSRQFCWFPELRYKYLEFLFPSGFELLTFFVLMDKSNRLFNTQVDIENLFLARTCQTHVAMVKRHKVRPCSLLLHCLISSFICHCHCSQYGFFFLNSDHRKRIKIIFFCHTVMMNTASRTILVKVKSFMCERNVFHQRIAWMLNNEAQYYKNLHNIGATNTDMLLEQFKFCPT